MPRTFAELGAKEEDIPYLVDQLCDGNGQTEYLNGYVKLDKNDVRIFTGQ